ncbi:TetR/AcrR family transcriptional regulator [Mycetocola zhujimingii]|uniref:TetR/AcrR family transcriptional regulator n=1 Tax=Mycetocola zhujimingii TaxID=2079792 RepID=UPI000D33F281|nr:TetR/AcrR family transcriptional regulator [Mycetocola zhujimingii]AWB86789.1 TetR family transcriptional regulator [Mycetocola zhujimingii]
MKKETDPRFQRSREAILDAARHLLVTAGPSAVTHARIAEHAGIGRATVYRHWPTSAELLAEAMTTVPMPFFDSPKIPTREWLRVELVSLARQLDHHDVRVVAATLASTALWDDGMDARRSRFAQTLSKRLAACLVDAQNRGEIVLLSDPLLAAAQVIGPIYYRSTIEHKATDDDMIDASIAGLGEWQ